MKRQRDYAAEYARRIQRGTERGITRSQARGHSPARKVKRIAERAASVYDRGLENALRSFRESHNLTKSAKQHHKSAERLRRYAQQNRAVRKVGRKWVFLRDNRTRETAIYTNGEFKMTAVKGFARASKARLYMADTDRFLRSNNVAFLNKWKGEGVEDADGRWVPFETRPNVIYRLDATDKEPFEQIYRIVI